MTTRAELEAILKFKEEMSAKVAAIDRSLGKLENAVKKNTSGTARLGDSFKKGALQAVGLGTAVGASALALAKLSQVAQESVKSFALFQSTMTKIETLVGISREEVAGFSEEVKKISLATGRGPQELAEALFFVTSAGLRGKDALDVLEQSAKSAAIGLGATKDVADAATSILNAYGSANITAEEAVGTLLKTVREGKLAPEELASSLGKVIPIAAAMGVEITEVGGAVAQLTRVGTSTSEAVTSLTGIMSAFLKPSAEAEKILAKLGLTAAGLREEIATRGLVPVIEELRSQLGAEEFAKVIGQVEALRGALSLTGDSFKTTSDIIASVEDNLTVLGGSFQRVQEDTSHRADLLSAKWANSMKIIGKASTETGFSITSDIGLAVDGLAQAFGRAGSAIETLGAAASDNIESLRLFFGASSEFGQLDESLEGLLDSLPPVSSETTKLGGTLSDVEKRARDMVEAELKAAAAAKNLGDSNEEGAKAAAKYAEEIQKLADKLGGAGLRKEMDQVEKAILSLGGASELSTGGMSSLDGMIQELRDHSIELTPELQKVADRLRELDELANTIVKDFGPDKFKGFGFIEDTGPERFKGLIPVLTEMETKTQDNIELTEKWEIAQENYNERLQQAADLVNILPGPLGEIVGLTVSASSAFDALKGLGGDGGLLGGFKNAFSAGKGGAGGLTGILGGIGSVASFAAPFAALGIAGGTALIKGLKSLFGRSGADAMKEVARDLGATVSEEMADAIAKTGRPVQLAIAEIFEAGGFETADRFAEEIGDLFSGFMRGDFSEQDLFSALNESVPLLAENIESLGATGVQELERIFAAAAATGTAFEGMDVLAKAYVDRARELGVEINNVALETLGLGDALATAFAPNTVEEIAKQFDLTNDQVRELAELAGANVQTNLERMASELGLTVEQYREFAQLLGTELDIDLTQEGAFEEIGALLESLGADAVDLAKKLGIDVTGGAESIDPALQNSNEELNIGIDRASRLADELGRAADNAGMIHIPAAAGGGGGGGGGVPTTGAQHGFEGRVTGPHAFFIEPGVTEDVSITRPGDGGDSGAVVGELRALRAALPSDVARAVRDAFARTT